MCYFSYPVYLDVAPGVYRCGSLDSDPTFESTLKYFGNMTFVYYGEYVKRHKAVMRGDESFETGKNGIRFMIPRFW